MVGTPARAGADESLERAAVSEHVGQVVVFVFLVEGEWSWFDSECSRYGEGWAFRKVRTLK